jgi:hypothetical protein
MAASPLPASHISLVARRSSLLKPLITAQIKAFFSRDLFPLLLNPSEKLLVRAFPLMTSSYLFQQSRLKRGGPLSLTFPASLLTALPM